MAKRKFRPIPTLTPKQRAAFFSLIDQRGPDECWPWTGRTSHKNPKFRYGVFSVQDDYMATRIAYREHYGIDPQELWVCHKCDNPPCVNPAHFFLGTYQDNVDDMVNKRRHMHGERHYMKQEPWRGRGEANNWSKLTEKDVIAIREEYAQGGISMLKLGIRYGVDASAIFLIIKRRNWAHIP